MKSLKLIGMLGALMLLGIFAAAPVSATHVDPVFVDGNPDCESLGFDFEVKIDPPVNGTFPAGNPPGFITLSNVVIGSPGSFDWESNLTILAVIAKGGSGANVYYYNPPPTFEDDGLVFPQGASHISFCFDNPNVPQGEPLDVEKDAEGAFETKYTWDIDKAVVGESTQTGMPGDIVTFDYTVTVSHDGGVTGGYEVTGTITVTNANAYDVTGVDITDELNDGTVCTVTGGTDATIPANDSADFAYSCSPADDSATENTVTIDWPDQAGPPMLPAGSADFTAAVSFTETIIDECIDVQDDLGGAPALPDTVCVGDPNPTVFNYSLDFTVPEFGCDEHTNTADFETNDTGTTGSDSVTVTVCSELEGCTPGYWKASQHFDSWVATGYAPTNTVGSVFTGAPSPNHTLLQALNYGGGNTLTGAKQILLRAGVAALLNAAHPDITYQFTTAEVIAMVNSGLASSNRSFILGIATELDDANNANCVLN